MYVTIYQSKFFVKTYYETLYFPFMIYFTSSVNPPFNCEYREFLHAEEIGQLLGGN